MNMLNKFLNVWRWHPEVFIRYWPIVKEIKKQKPKSILEIGSGWLGIAPYLGEKIVGLDKDFENKKFSLLKQVKGDVLKIPFGKDTFESVICVDVLEHLSREKRKKAIEEILRVAKKMVLIGVPCNSQSQKQDEKLAINYQKIFGRPFSFFDEHLKFGLPTVEEIKKLIEISAQKNGKKISLTIQGNENLALREFLMKGWMTKNSFVDFIFRKLFLFFLPFFKWWDKPPYYRWLFFVKIKS